MHTMQEWCNYVPIRPSVILHACLDFIILGKVRDSRPIRRLPTDSVDDQTDGSGGLYAASRCRALVVRREKQSRPDASSQHETLGNDNAGKGGRGPILDNL